MTHPWTEGARRHVLRCHFRNRYTCTGRRGSLYPTSRLSDKMLLSRLLGTDLEAEKIFILPKCRWETSALADLAKKLSASPFVWVWTAVRQNKSNKEFFNWSVWQWKQKAHEERAHLTNCIAFPAATALTEACAVHHVALVVPLVKRLAHFIVVSVYNTLIWWPKTHLQNSDLAWALSL